MWKKMTIGKKLVCGFGSVLTVLGLLIVLSFTGVGGIVGKSPEIVEIAKLIGQVSKSDAAVLVFAVAMAGVVARVPEALARVEARCRASIHRRQTFRSLSGAHRSACMFRFRRRRGSLLRL